MPVCGQCKCHNSLGTKTCKQCGQTIIQDEGRSCPICSEYCGPFSQNCRKCGYNFTKRKPPSKSSRPVKKSVIVNANRNNLVEFAFSEQRNGFLKQNDMNGINSPGYAKEKIRFLGPVDPFTKETLYENYEIIAENLKVYPTVVVYQRGTKLPGGHSGFYSSSLHEIQIVDAYYLISTLAHEMRHAYQYIYLPDLFFGDRITNAKEYYQAEIEIDARQYERHYCIYREYFDEYKSCEYNESQIKLFLTGKITAQDIGVDDNYYRQNPQYPKAVSRNYQEEYQNRYIETKRQTQIFSQSRPSKSFKFWIMWLFWPITLLWISFKLIRKAFVLSVDFISDLWFDLRYDKWLFVKKILIILGVLLAIIVGIGLLSF
ncbi:hypothetical protein MKX57_19630 [Lysinibacillus sp. FSL M8-0216]|uniref:hypothetical protein n=1 Tax=Lysinibacillus sp. FSL M8-0216 TaxID=2921619 RepID=UPI00315A27B8